MPESCCAQDRTSLVVQEACWVRVGCVSLRAGCCLQEPPVTNSYFVFFKTQKAAAAAAQCSIFPEGALDSFQVVGAPGPEEVTTLLSSDVSDAGCIQLTLMMHLPWP